MGILFALNVDLSIFPLYDHAIARIFWHTDEIPPEVKDFRQFVAGPLGGTITCSYLLLAYLAWYPFQQREKWARNAITIAFTFWCLIDSYICFNYQVYFQIYLINSLSVLQKALPIICTWNAFKN
jgi:hypothetical protein